MKNFVLITGASSGIGRALAYEFARHGYDLVLVSRNLLSLEQVQKDIVDTFSCRVEVFSYDLSEGGAAKNLYDDVLQRGIVIDVLVNNAGFANFGVFTHNDWENEEDLLTLSVVTVSQLCHLFGGEMVMRRRGHVLNVSSIAGFIPGPLMATYYASKGFEILFSEALACELKQFGVQVSVLCAGRTATEFKIKGYMGEKEASRLLPKMSPEKVAHIAYQELFKGTVVIIPGFVNKVQVFLVKFIPRSILVWIAQYRLKKQ
jgi:short-subunit dehydrogenase